MLYSSNRQEAFIHRDNVYTRMCCECVARRKEFQKGTARTEKRAPTALIITRGARLQHLYICIKFVRGRVACIMILYIQVCTLFIFALCIFIYTRWLCVCLRRAGVSLAAERRKFLRSWMFNGLASSFASARGASHSSPLRRDWIKYDVFFPPGLLMRAYRPN